MYRNTTPTLRLNLKSKDQSGATTPLDPNLFDDFIITLKCGDVQIDKAKKDCDVKEDVIEVTLTQEETLMLPEDESVKIQMRLIKDKDVIPTNIANKLVKEILDENVYKWN